MAEQPYVTFNDGQAYPQIGLGVWQVEKDQVCDNVLTALKTGYRHIDTAWAYQNEVGVGEAVRATDVPRDQIKVTSKLWNKYHGFDEALRMFEDSDKRLNVGPLDLFLIHWPIPSRDLYLETWKALVRLQEEGRIKSIGVSNFTLDHLERIIGETGIAPVVNQIELYPRFQQRDLRAFHAKHNIIIESWSPLASGRLLDDPILAGIGEKHGKSVAQVIIRWHLHEGLIVLPKSATASRVVSNFDVLDFELDATDMAAIVALDSSDGRDGPDPAEFAYL